MTAGIVLVHGYTGSAFDLEILYEKLAAAFGTDSVNCVRLPGHDSGGVPGFDENRFLDAIADACSVFQKQKLVVIGHSTGGNLSLAALAEKAITPDLLILAAAPKKIDGAFLDRWKKHRSGKAPVALDDLAPLVKLVNVTGTKRPAANFPALILHGEADELVPCRQSEMWCEGFFEKPARLAIIPEAGHHLFSGPTAPLAIDLILRAVSDLDSGNRIDSNTSAALNEIEPGFKDFLSATPSALAHLTQCPGVRSALGKGPDLGPTARSDPLIANIEITTHCNLKCRFCARTRLRKTSRHMPFGAFRNILALLPNTYRITLVGLGEPLLHPEFDEFIGYAKSLGKKVGLVTNAMLLNEEAGRKLLDAKPDSIAFSLDASRQESSDLVRKGTDLARVIDNIGNFVRLAKTTGANISMAVFSAVSIDTAAGLNGLVDCVSDLGVDALMLTDLNFKANLEHSLWKNPDENIAAMVRAAISHAFAKGLPVLSVRGLEEFGLESRYRDFLLIPPDRLYQRSARRTHCLSPWQTLPVGVDGTVTCCDCQPDLVIGKLWHDPFSGIWNGETAKRRRAEMLGPNPPEACRICPRF
ncbi:MAG: alpha/beta fold hydrolase [Candidatus Accumulibacter sp.]|jgi:MoaA/NifB/PqqE/SkfB family radical SAM enzyme/alpha-beta hydrolase superfamily lysophospholipase|nr:alpha/beta fold hydrolase [Accumulibacter sp.]